MATGQATEAAKPGRLGNDGNAACRHFFPAPEGSQRDASAKGLGNPGSA